MAARIKYLVDTNHLSIALVDVELRNTFIEAHIRGHRFGTCIGVLCELEAGLQFAEQRIASQNILTTVLDKVRLWPMDGLTAAEYGRIFVELRKKGRVLSAVDMMLAAVARQLNRPILTADRDFEALPDIATENWL